MPSTNNKYDVHSSAHDDVEIICCSVAQRCDIPANLVELTKKVIAIHRANGDLAWLADAVFDAMGPREMANYDINDYLP